MSLAPWPLLFTLALPLVGQGLRTSPPHTVAEMNGRYRPLLIFAADGDPKLNEQMHRLTSHRDDLIDRQIMLVPAYQKWAGGGDWEIMTLMGREEPSLRHRFHIHPDDFTVILLGKDGGEKFHSHTLVTIERLNQIIDVMPMRRQEMKSRPPH